MDVHPGNPESLDNFSFPAQDGSNRPVRAAG